MVVSVAIFVACGEYLGLVLHSMYCCTLSLSIIQLDLLLHCQHHIMAPPVLLFHWWSGEKLPLKALGPHSSPWGAWGTMAGGTPVEPPCWMSIGLWLLLTVWMERKWTIIWTIVCYNYENINPNPLYFGVKYHYFLCRFNQRVSIRTEFL